MRAMTEKSLSDLIVSQALEPSTFDTRPEKYCPRDKFDAFVTEEAIARQLVNGRRELVRWIYNNARKIFVIMVVSGFRNEEVLTVIRRIRANGLTDDCLPISKPNNDDGPNPQQLLWEGESITQRDNFFDKQWRFIIPVFSKTQFHHDLQPETILPFEEIETSSINQGGFSHVRGFKVHPAHQYPGYAQVAIKEIQLNGQMRTRDVKSEVDKEWEKEARALEDINGLHHGHVIRCLAAIRKGRSRYFMFPLANSNLTEFWKETREQAPSPVLIRESIHQIYQLSDALYCLHNFERRSPKQSDDASGSAPPVSLTLEGQPIDQVDEASTSNIRHGDLKPDNILRFLSGDDNNSNNDLKRVGKLKIADMGLAKHHLFLTQDRSVATETKYGTALYEPPEARDKNPKVARSRLYDIWSMGCIIFEFIIWLLYGYDMVDNLHKELRKAGFQYFEPHIEENNTKARVHTVIKRWVQHIKMECNTDSAIKDLIELVEKKLLVIDLPPRRPSAANGSLRVGALFEKPDTNDELRSYRATAEELRDSLLGIHLKTESDEWYAFTKNSRGAITPPSQPDDNLQPTHDILSNTKPMNTDYSLPPLDQWEFSVDDAFARKALDQLGAKAFRPQKTAPATLCDRCRGYRFWLGGFYIEVKAGELLDGRLGGCELCQMLWEAHKNGERKKALKVRFVRDGSMLRISGSDSLPVLSLLGGPELKAPTPIQLGFPELLQPGTQEFFHLIKLWLQDCDNDHTQCSATGQIPLPTRLIDVGTDESPELRLIETRETAPKSTKYIALSHRWGDEKTHFSTLRKDHSGCGRELNAFKIRIPEDELPATFKDAVVTARTLDVRYLWIDSLCIVQGDEGDFKEESKNMETVFSCAYCVLAASRATSQRDGFLKRIEPRKYITLPGKDKQPFYVCQWVDDFGRHVLDGPLNKRGWVLQERALARRTIFFTEKQTYFECGEGIRCQSLTKMRHNMVDFLGDPKFPSKAMNSRRGLKIVYFQDLYKQYSRLDFTRVEDRPFAIDGLENRLRTAYETKGGYGIFDDGQGKGLFHRSLLWQRPEAPEGALVPWLSRIAFSPERNVSVPTWSWMAYQGGIDYLAPEFDKTDWETGDIQPPWSNTNGMPAHSPKTKLVATARDFNVAGSREAEAKLIYDTDRQRPGGTRRVQCVVVAKSKHGQVNADRRYYVLIVEPTDSTNDVEKVYERVGAGFMLGKFITLDKPGTGSELVYQHLDQLCRAYRSPRYVLRWPLLPGTMHRTVAGTRANDALIRDGITPKWISMAYPIPPGGHVALVFRGTGSQSPGANGRPPEPYSLMPRKGSSRQIITHKTALSYHEMEPAKLQAPAASKQAAIVPSSHDATRKTYLLGSSRFMTDSSEGIGILPPQHQTADLSQPTLKPQHLLVNTRVQKSYDGSESGYQTSSIGKSPIATTSGTLSTEKTSPVLSIAQVTSDPDPLDLESGQHDEDVAHQVESQISLLNFSHQPNTVPTVDDNNETQRQDEASVLQGSGGWASNPDDGLNEQLYHVLADQGFLPENLLSDLINQVAVSTELRRILPPKLRQYIQKYADIICKDSDFQDAEECSVSYRKIFAILALVEKTGAIPMLIHEGVDDGKLPLEIIKRERTFELGYKKVNPAGGVSIEPLKCFKDWTRQKKDDFIRYQWSMLAPVFEEGEYNLVRHYVVYNQSQLPFIHQDDSTQDSDYDSNDEGGGGRVTMVNIHPHHHRFTNEALSKRGYAIKALHDPSRKAFERERDILSKFKGINEHENIVVLLATYELDYKLRHKFNMIFYRADGNLYDYWEQANPSPSFNHETMLWGSGQCRGLAHGLLQLHKHTTGLKSEGEGISQIGRHGDIKPKNILYYPKPGSANPTLVICDFGVSELRFRITGSAKDDALTLSYRAPECDIEGKSPGPPADIWSLGCVYLEFVAWFLGGFPLVDEFTSRRLSYDVRLLSLTLKTDAFFESDEASHRKVKDAVTQSIGEFHSNPRCTQYLHEFLDLIEREMLVMDPTDRIKCPQLYERLNRMFERCKNSEGYAMDAMPKAETPAPSPGDCVPSEKKPNHDKKFYPHQGFSEHIRANPIHHWQSSHTSMREDKTN
ncbi:hypothetical protein O1611_g1897 [Lasiodiplodia mahajangana]|uniref:Uncharacterized protein n=1 Tax=Lasiodiplodia mahajangana TaxID=1108764 RepID=A0ACC2JWS4_9PEZI|nr:hypothetical protein O1611_g1897 [Lasiodiplodia mahajangana]